MSKRMETESMAGDVTASPPAQAVPGHGIEASFATGFWAYANPAMVHIVFGDQVSGGDVTYHRAVVMTVEDARELADLLMRMLTPAAPLVETTESVSGWGLPCCGRRSSRAAAPALTACASTTR